MRRRALAVYPMLRSVKAALAAVVVTTPGLWSQVTEPQAASLAMAAAQAMEPGLRAALRDGQPVSFEHRSPWGEMVKRLLEEAIGSSLTSEHRRGTSRILLGDPRFDEDTAIVGVWFGRCEGAQDAETLRIRGYSFSFEREREGESWKLLGASRIGTTEGSCDGDWKELPAVQT